MKSSFSVTSGPPMFLEPGLVAPVPIVPIVQVEQQYVKNNNDSASRPQNFKLQSTYGVIYGLFIFIVLAMVEVHDKYLHNRCDLLFKLLIGLEIYVGGCICICIFIGFIYILKSSIIDFL